MNFTSWQLNKRKEIVFWALGIRNKFALFFVKPIVWLASGGVLYKEYLDFAKTIKTVEADFKGSNDSFPVTKKPKRNKKKKYGRK